MSQHENFDLELTREWQPGDADGGNTVLNDSVVYRGYAFRVAAIHLPGSHVDGLVYVTRTIIDPTQHKSFGGPSVHLRHLDTGYATWDSLDALNRAIEKGEVYAA